MSGVDVAIIVSYILGCTALGAWMGSGTKGLKSYFLGESNIPAWAVMISIVATETSAVTFLSVPGVAYDGDLTYLQLPIGYIFARIVVALVLLPLYFRGEIYTAYQVLEKRFGAGTQKAASILFLVTRNLGSGLRLLLAAEVLRVLTGWSIATSVCVIGVSTLFYTFLGGIKGVVWTDVIQFFIYLIGALIALKILLGHISGGWTTLIDQAQAAGKLRMFNFDFDLTKPYTFWAGVIGGLVLDTGTHGADQMMVQRYLTARSQRQAGQALIASGFVILVQFALFMIIGVGLYVLYQQAPPAHALKSDERFAYFIAHYLPVGVRGLVIAAVFSVTMSTVSGALSASASSTVNDLYRPFVPQADERHLLRVSKGLTAFWGLVEIGIALGAVGLKDNVVNNALAVASFITGILLGLFLLGILSKRASQTAALLGMLTGVAVVSYVKFGTSIAWPWYALIGSSTVVLVGMALSPLLPAGEPARQAPEAALE